MKFSLLLIGLVIIPLVNTFKTEQLKHDRVREACDQKAELIESLLKKHNVSIDKMHIFIRAFKEESYLELWAKNVDDEKFQLISTYDICSKSGQLGPKRQQGDLQVPEGFYHIDRFNPWSNYHLSLGINYPNKSDRIISNASRLGGDIFIHGNCVTIGCMPMTDDKMEEIYLFAMEARNNGQNTIPVRIFPFNMTESNINYAKEKYDLKEETFSLWSELQQSYEYFNNTKKIPPIKFLDSGRHLISE